MQTINTEKRLAEVEKVHDIIEEEASKVGQIVCKCKEALLVKNNKEMPTVSL